MALTARLLGFMYGPSMPAMKIRKCINFKRKKRKEKSVTGSDESVCLIVSITIEMRAFRDFSGKGRTSGDDMINDENR